MAHVNILLVEDESIEAMDIKRMLESFGYKVPYIASRGEEAIEQAFKIKPDLILMDIVLKGEINGIEAATKIKDLDIPVIYLTAHSEEPTIERAKHTMPYGYLIKPYDPTELKYALELAIYKNKMEKELKKSEADLLRAQKLGHMGSWEWDISNNTLHWSEEIYNLYGLDKDFELTFNSIENMIHPEDREYNLKMVKNILEKEDEAEYEFRIIRPNGDIGHILQTIKVTRDEKNKAKIAFGTMLDITKSKKAEEDLKFHIEWLDFAQHASKSGFWNWDMATDKLTWSSEFLELFGLSPETEPSFDVWKETLHPADLEPAMNKINSSIENHEFLENEYRIILPNGKERWIQAWGSTVYDENDQPQRMSGICIDITENKIMKENLREKNVQIEAIFESMNSALVIMDNNREFYMMNDAAVLFHRFKSKEEYLRKLPDYYDLFELYSLDGTLLPTEDWPAEKAFRGEQLRNFEVLLKRKDTGESWIASYNTSTVYSEQGELDFIVFNIDEITERKNNENRINKLYRLNATLSQINQNIVKIKNRDELFKKICRVCVEYGKFRMAWIGLIDQKTKKIRPVTHYGHEKGYLKKISIHTHDKPTADPPTNLAIKKGDFVIIDDVKKELNRSWREEALKRDYKSLVSIPLKLRGNPIAILNIYSSQPHFFTEEEAINLINEIGGDISYAIDSIETQKEKEKLESKLKKAGKSLKESENKLRSIVSTVPIGLGIASERKIRWTNNNLLQLLDYKKEEIIGKKTSKLYPSDEEFKRAGDKFYGELGEKGRATVETKWKHKDGRILDMHLTGELLDRKEPSKGLVFAGLNITDLKNAERTIKERANFFNSTLNDMVTFVAVLKPDSQIYFVNNTPLDLIEKSLNEVVGKNFHDIEWWTDSTRNKIKEDVKKCAQGEKIYHEIQVNTKDGMIWIDFSMHPIYDENGIIKYIIPEGRDITERKKVEEELKGTSDYLEKLINYANAPIIVWDHEFKITRFNHAFEHLTDYTVDEVIGNDLEMLFPKETKEKSLQKINLTSSGEFWEAVEIPILRKDGEIRSALWNSANIYAEDDSTVIATIAQGQDITEWKKAQKDLEESLINEKLLGDIIRNASVAVAIGYPDGRIGMFNKAFQELTGYSEVELNSIDWSLELTPKKWRESEQKHLDELLKNKKAVQYEKEYIRKDGSIVPIELVVHPRFDGKGKLDYYFAFLTDITERKKAERALTESKERYRIVADFTYDWEYWLGPDRNFIYVSPSCERMTGYKPEEFIKDPFLLEKITNPKDSEQFLRHIHGENLNEETSDLIRFSITTKNGQKKWIGHGCQPVYSKKGEFMGRRASNRDVTNLIKAEDKLKNERQRFFDVLETMPVMVCILSTDYHVIFANRSFREKFGESHGRPCYEYCFGKKEPCDFCESFKPLETGKPHHWEISTPEGSFIDVYDYPYKDIDGSPLILKVYIDITEHKKAEEEIKASLLEKETLLREIHHRVKNNLQIIASLLRLQEYLGNDEIRNVLKESEGRVRIMAMVHEKLYRSSSLSNINSKEYINGLISDVFYNYGIKKEDITTNLQLEDVNLNIETIIPLGLIINEIVTNSVKYAFPQGNGKITIKLKKGKGDEYNLIIRDNGIGIPENIDIEKTETLGLKLVNVLTSQIDGQIKLDRTKGTQFKITFKELEYPERI
jgi:PAS domain S-box-containing protein